MRTSIAGVLLVLLGSGAACTPPGVSGDHVAADAAASTAPGPGLMACHRAAAPAWKPGASPGDARTARRRAAHRVRTLLVDLAQVEAVVAARMPNHDLTLRRALATAIDEEARRAGLDPLLILALIHVESSFDPAAASYAGAMGLMQLRERTLHRELERAGLALADRRDPVVNVRAGIRYLRRLVSAFGSTELALMAYNAGPNRILSYYRAGDIPERFHAYPRRIQSERERLRFGVERRLRGAAAPSSRADS